MCVLVKVITRSEVPPALIVPGVNDLETNGTLAVTASRSATVHVPEAQPAAVLDTPAGAEIEAVLVIWVCARAACEATRESAIPSINANALKTLLAEFRQKITRPNALNNTDKLYPNEMFIVTKTNRLASVRHQS